MDPADKHALLQLARETIRASLANDPLPEPPAIATADEPFGGAFVTIKNHGRLRGCIGRFGSEGNLPETVQRMAVASLNDPRFLNAPVRLDELDELDIEISILSSMTKTDDPMSLVPGVHGVHIRQGFQSGCFLPQVATEQKWDTEELLSRCCAGKAGLSADAWKSPETEVFLFTAEVFGERG